MKNTKKIISLVLAICMLASLAISASAANTVDASGGAQEVDWTIRTKEDMLACEAAGGIPIFERFDPEA